MKLVSQKIWSIVITFLTFAAPSARADIPACSADLGYVLTLSTSNMTGTEVTDVFFKIFSANHSLLGTYVPIGSYLVLQVVGDFVNWPADRLHELVWQDMQVFNNVPNILVECNIEGGPG